MFKLLISNVKLSLALKSILEIYDSIKSILCLLKCEVVVSFLIIVLLLSLIKVEVELHDVKHNAIIKGYMKRLIMKNLKFKL